MTTATAKARSMKGSMSEKFMECPMTNFQGSMNDQ